MASTSSTTVFTVFPNLPIELRSKIWEHAFPSRVVNLIYDQYNDQYHSFNTSVPLLLHINRESRQLGLKRYHLCFGTESSEPCIYFDFKRDILLFDDYQIIGGANPPNYSGQSSSYKESLKWEDHPMTDLEESQIQRVAINSTLFQHYPTGSDQTVDSFQPKQLQKAARPLAVKFTSLKELSLVIESVNPCSKGPIRFFEIGTATCNPICEICYTARFTREGVQHLRVVYGSIFKFRLVGAYRGTSRFDLGCYEEFIEADPADDVSELPNLEDVLEVNEKGIRWAEEWKDPTEYDLMSDGETDKDIRESLSEYLKNDLYQQYEYLDNEDDDFPDDDSHNGIPEAELVDIKVDEEAYKKGLDGRSYVQCQDSWVPAEYYERRMELHYDESMIVDEEGIAD